MSRQFLATRRRALEQLGLFLGTLVLGLPVDAKHGKFGTSVPPALARAVSGLVRNSWSAAVIGEVYLAQNPGERSADRLSQCMLKGGPATVATIDERFLLERVRCDFERGDVVNLQGWILSRTEARLCALYAL